jgi:tetratricopeptide (TPR) repeat protein
VFLCAASLIHPLLAQGKDTTNIREHLAKVDETIRELRRDQLNYQIERDLLKEAFSSNYQTVNVVLAIVLGVFSFIGFLGIRDIGSIRKEYTTELEKLNNLQKDFEIKITQYESEQTKAKENYLSIMRTNDEQNRRIKILELQEKVASLLKSRNFQRALEYITIALEMDPTNIWMYIEKGWSLLKLGDLGGSITAYSKASELDPSNILVIENLIELYLLTNRFADYKEIYTKNKATIKSKAGDALCTYFEALESYLQQDVPKLKKNISDYLSTLTPDKQKISPWDFNDVLNALKPKPDNSLGAFLLLLIEVIRGGIDRDGALKKLNEI